MVPQQLLDRSASSQPSTVPPSGRSPGGQEREMSNDPLQSQQDTSAEAATSHPANGPASIATPEQTPSSDRLYQQHHHSLSPATMLPSKVTSSAGHEGSHGAAPPQVVPRQPTPIWTGAPLPFSAHQHLHHAFSSPSFGSPLLTFIVLGGVLGPLGHA
jgi:hypothetical protein